MEIYVGNLPWSISDQELADAFGAYGNVEKASIISDRHSGRSKGFGPLSYERSRIIRKNSTMEIYVGNLPWSISDQELADAFGAYGNVEKASIISDRDSGRSKGFGFVTMNDADEANKAIEAMNGAEMGGRNLKVNEARPREERPPRKDNW
jgi:RNA recognition motif-containing protein